jgi:hypothetical protein
MDTASEYLDGTPRPTIKKTSRSMSFPSFTGSQGLQRLLRKKIMFLL